MIRQLWLRLRSVPLVWVLLMVAVFVPSATIAYDGHNETEPAYDDCVQPTVLYDAVPALLGNEKNDGINGTCGAFAEFTNFLAAESATTVSRIRNVAQQGYDYAVLNPRMQGLNRMQLGKDAEVQATRWLRRWAERNDVNLGPGGLQFQVRGANSVPDVVFDPAGQIFDFKLTPRAVRPTQTGNFQTDFPGYNIEYIFGP